MVRLESLRIELSSLSIAMAARCRGPQSVSSVNTNKMKEWDPPTQRGCYTVSTGKSYLDGTDYRLTVTVTACVVRSPGEYTG